MSKNFMNLFKNKRIWIKNLCNNRQLKNELLKNTLCAKRNKQWNQSQNKLLFLKRFVQIGFLLDTPLQLSYLKTESNIMEKTAHGSGFSWENQRVLATSQSKLDSKMGYKIISTLACALTLSKRLKRASLAQITNR